MYFQKMVSKEKLKIKWHTHTRGESQDSIKLTLDTSPPSTSNFIAESLRPESATFAFLLADETTWLLLVEEPGAGRLVPTVKEEEGWEEFFS